MAQAGGAPAVEAKAAKPPAAPVSLLGDWEVERVLVDLADQPHWGLRPDDPTLLYRSMTIEPDAVRLAGEDDRCKQARWKPLATTWKGLFRKSAITRSPSNSASTQATPADYDLKVPESERVSAYLICPRAGESAAKAWRGGAWLVLQSPDTLVMRYSDQVLLLLHRRAQNAPPSASFVCDTAKTAAAKTICSHVELAAWDRSVAEAFRQALERQVETSDKKRLLETQIQWKAQRESCAADVACLENSMYRRVYELIQE